VNDLARVEVEESRGRCILRIHGEIDISNAREVLATIQAVVPNGAQAIVVDLSETAYLDSSGVHLLLLLADRLRARRQELSLVVPSTARIRALLEVAGVPKLIQMRDHLDAERAEGPGGAVGPGTS
jgi:anti-sigma B factor antagonist